MVSEVHHRTKGLDILFSPRFFSLDFFFFALSNYHGTFPKFFHSFLFCDWGSLINFQMKTVFIYMISAKHIRDYMINEPPISRVKWKSTHNFKEKTNIRHPDVKPEFLNEPPISRVKWNKVPITLKKKPTLGNRMLNQNFASILTLGSSM